MNKLLTSKQKTQCFVAIKKLYGIFHRMLPGSKSYMPFFPPRKNQSIIDLINKTRKEVNMLMDDYTAYQLFEYVSKTSKIDGDLAEVGVYQGAGTRIICEAKHDRVLYSFDTFGGLHDCTEIDDPGFYNTQYASSYESVSKYLEKYNNFHLVKGIFPDTASIIADKKFSFVYLDVDTYQSTMDCMRFFYPRMNAGGIIISHDYSTSKGVPKALDEYMQDKPEIIIELPGSWAMISKSNSLQPHQNLYI